MFERFVVFTFFFHLESVLAVDEPIQQKRRRDKCMWRVLKHRNELILWHTSANRMQSRCYPCESWFWLHWSC